MTWKRCFPETNLPCSPPDMHNLKRETQQWHNSETCTVMKWTMREISYHCYYTSQQCEYYKGDESVVSRKSRFGGWGWNVGSRVVEMPVFLFHLLHRCPSAPPQLTPLWHIQWSAVTVIPTKRPCLSHPGKFFIIVLESQADTVYKEWGSWGQYGGNFGFKEVLLS